MARVRRVLYRELLAAVLLAAVGAGGCAGLIADGTPIVMGDAEEAFFHEKSYLHAKRAGPGLLMLMDGFIRSSPDNWALLLPAAEMNCSYAQGMAEPEDKAWASALYRKGRDYAIRALVEHSDDFEDALRAPQADFERVLREEFDERHIGALFWGAMCWGSWINVNMDRMEAVAELPRAKAMMQRAMELDESFYHAGAHLFFGMLAGSLPEMIGGDQEACERHFAKVFEITQGRFLLAHVFYAKSCAVQAHDRARFVKTLKHVLAAPDDIDPNIPLFTAVAKKLAGDLLKSVDTLFLPVEGEEPGSAEDDTLDDLLGE